MFEHKINCILITYADDTVMHFKSYMVDDFFATIAVATFASSHSHKQPHSQSQIIATVSHS